ncbi:MAG: YhcN/YlaJ family sporulation lipoprotein [Alicyclobacillaceae bacterium]|nr:YhcN/YlaJ family sporulation lipoprotein [Alicyclobacillaceae bacterium]
MSRLKALVAGVAVWAVCSGSLTACAPGREPGAAPGPAPRLDRSRVDVDGDGDRSRWAKGQDILNPPVQLGTVPSPRSGAASNGGTAALADRIADVAQSVPGVQSAAAVVRGRQAYVGLRLSPNIRDSGRVNQVKTEVRQRLLIQAPVVYRVHVTDDRQLTRQIEEVADAVRAGRPVQDFSGRIDEWERLIPPTAPKVEPPVPSPSRFPTEKPPAPALPNRPGG